MLRDPSPLADARALFAWIRLLERLRPAAVCLGTPKASLVGLLAAFLLRIPARIYLIRGLRFESETGIRRRLLLLVERLTAGLATDVIAVSPSLRLVAESAGVGGGRSITVLGPGSSNGVDIHPEDTLARLRGERVKKLQAMGLDPTVPVVAFVGRVRKDKGVAVLAQALVDLKRCGSDAQLLLVGGEEGDGFEDSVRGLLTMGGVVHAFTGHVSSPEEYMTLADVLCLPSFREGLPNVCLEAASLGIAVVTTDATGCRDSILDGRTGVLTRCGDAVDLMRGLQVLIGDEDLRRRLGAAGREWVAKEFARELVWARYETYYASVLADRSPHARRESVRVTR